MAGHFLIVEARFYEEIVDDLIDDGPSNKLH